MTTTNLISLEEAARLTGNFRKQKESLIAREFGGKNVLPICETFPRDAFDKLLSQQGCVGVRVYFGMDEENQVRLVVVGVDKEGRDMLASSSPVSNNKLRIASTESGGYEGDDNVIIENGARCPEICPPGSELNG